MGVMLVLGNLPPVYIHGRPQRRSSGTAAFPLLTFSISDSHTVLDGFSPVHSPGVSSVSTVSQALSHC